MSEEKRDYVAETVKTFITGSDMEPTDPVKAIEAYFEKNASADLKARAKAEGKTAKTCWTFIEAVAREALHGHSGHIDPVVVYAIAMHYFDDIPVDWNKKSEVNTKAKEETKVKAKAKVKKHFKKQQGFFFDMIETPTVGPDAASDGKEAGDVNAQ